MVLVEVRQTVVHENVADEVSFKGKAQSALAGRIEATVRVEPDLLGTRDVGLYISFKFHAIGVVDDMLRNLQKESNFFTDKNDTLFDCEFSLMTHVIREVKQTNPDRNEGDSNDEESGEYSASRQNRLPAG